MKKNIFERTRIVRVKNMFIALLACGVLFVSACSSQQTTVKKPQETAAQKQADENQKTVKQNQEIQKEINQALVNMVKNATMQKVQGKDATGSPETWYEYTFKNTSKFTFTMMQLGWTAVKTDGTTTTDSSEPLFQEIKPNATFKLHARLYSEAKSYKDIFLQGNAAPGSLK